MSLYDAIAEHIAEGRMEDEEVDIKDLTDFVAAGDGLLDSWGKIDDGLDALTAQYRDVLADRARAAEC